MVAKATATLAIVFAIAETLALHPLSDAFIDHINSFNTTWKAGRNFHPDTPISEIKIRLGVLKSNFRLPKRTEFLNTEDLPEKFDPREQWSYCSSLNEIRDQGRCGSCWAHGPVEMMTDRYCIYSEGKKQFHFSAEDITTCVDGGCQGGWPSDALEYWKKNGIVSGGNYGSGEGCRPYSIEHCDHTQQNKSDSCQPYDDTPKCKRTCQSNYSIAYNDDLKYGKDVYSILINEENIKAELYNKGPVVAVFDVYDDFPSYKSGVYQRVSANFLGGHAVKILGWGVEDGVKYWLCANSWSPNFGEKGFFKILRGSDHCGIEEDIVAGVPAED